MKVLIKGLEAHEDATEALQHGVDGIIVSNHGGRSIESYRGTIESLPEVVAAVNGRIPVLVDGGFRRGTDVIKALALGATAVGIGAPLSLGSERLWPARRGARARHHAWRTRTRDASVRQNFHRQNR